MPWLFEARSCQNAPPHTHVVLQGKVWSYEHECMVWYTSEAAEYPAGLCEPWAKDWQKWTQAHLRQSETNEMALTGKFKEKQAGRNLRGGASAKTGARGGEIERRDKGDGNKRKEREP